MIVKFLKNANEIRQKFIDRFVLSWEAFQVHHKDWITERARSEFPIDLDWWNNQSNMWDRVIPDFSNVSMDEALAFLRESRGSVLFMTEKGQKVSFRQKEFVDFVAEADAQELSERIEGEWFDTYRFAAQAMFHPSAFLPDDLYVFDLSMKWCVVFTHETTVWEADDLMKEAENRLCMMLKG